MTAMFGPHTTTKNIDRTMVKMRVRCHTAQVRIVRMTWGMDDSTAVPSLYNSPEYRLLTFSGGDANKDEPYGRVYVRRNDEEWWGG